MQAPGEPFGLPAFEVVYRGALPAVRQSCWQATRHQQDADDLAHDVMLRALRGYGRLPETSHVRNWLATITRNTCASWLRRRALVGWRRLDPRHAWPVDLAADAERADTQQRVRRTLAGLDPLHARLLLWHDRDGLSYPALAARLGWTRGQVRWQMAQAREAFRQQYAALGGQQCD